MTISVTVTVASHHVCVSNGVTSCHGLLDQEVRTKLSLTTMSLSLGGFDDNIGWGAANEEEDVVSNAIKKDKVIKCVFVHVP